MTPGDDPAIMLTAPIPATKAIKRSGLRADQIGAYEVNEAFAPVPLAWLAQVGADDKTLNVNGGALRSVALPAAQAPPHDDPLHHMRDNGIRYGLQTT